MQRTGYAHHIQRLMVLSNFALICGISPQEIEKWFHAAFIDAYDWVMQTNVIGMGQFADGGVLASKPYAASGNYINTSGAIIVVAVFIIPKNSRVIELVLSISYTGIFSLAIGINSSLKDG